MKVFIDTTGSDFFLSLYDENFKIISFKHIKKVQKKTELIPVEIDAILASQNKSVFDIKAFYITLGPGFFTGIRTSLTYIKTLALFLNFQIFSISSFALVKAQNNYKYIDARGNLCYVENQQNKSLSVQECFEDQIVDFDYQDLIDNFENIKDNFKLEKNIFEIQPLYIKKPQIGIKKW
ncbi:tRNA (adenosine(37)-N6)-threonylcarbamoyltransferase complex dimerization subunit type 1 TsaB [Mycoplasmopsis pulmonis]|nr:tRNA (adenosine(37)-N6)-threonylcarbamoyltransferase complex dimerization subunit type 1 TsaB [Mycoplasmopsis pulmonis]MDZ7293089.1 tRNA (adenosine(37)-N6)-threonylcarbamoyltransferase complex dimerization subunit type 1 TsaB [Mycoplasmopsis pulmonis]VEU67882.1 molecular chaperone [Mycoplasmopsis pulmonis]